jgi:hypothetical protein
MMTLYDAASYFNDDQFLDAYGGDGAFAGRLEPYPDTMRDSLVTERRILITAPDTEIPPRRTVTLGDQVWLIGTMSADTHRGRVLRNKYIVHRADDSAAVGTFADVLAGAPLTTLWASLLWVKEWRDSQESSAMTGEFNLFFGATESALLGKYTLARVKNRWYIHRAAYDAAGGVLVSIADELPGNVLVDAAYNTVTYNPKTDVRTTSASTIKALFIRWQSHFRYFSDASATYQPGDVKLVILKAALTPKAGDTVTAEGLPFRVIEVADEGDCWGLHIRHA